MRALLLSVLVLIPTLAAAERPLPTVIDVGMVPVPPAEAVSSRLIYLHRCPPAGCTINAGTSDDSRTNTSQIAEGNTTISMFKQSDAVWAAMLACVRATYAPFDVGVTDVDPGIMMPHFEHIVGGRPSELRSDIPNAGGVAPATCTEIPNAMTFTFDVYGPDADSLCWTAAQEIGHAFGLEHELDAKDPMTYLGGFLPKRFQASDAQCGEGQPRVCACTGGTQNTYEHILAMFGPGVPTAPTITVKSPTNGKTVQPHFVTRVNAMDDVAVDRVEMLVDGVLLAESHEPPFTIVAPDGIEDGPHTLELRAVDVQGTPGSTTIDIVMGPPCTAAKGCSGVDVCVNGVCLPGPDAPGGLGNQCQANTECISLKCITDSGTGDRYCVEACDPAAQQSCPSDFECLATGEATGVCWPAPGGGCCDAGGSPAGPAGLALGVLALVLRRRRDRR